MANIGPSAKPLLKGTFRLEQICSGLTDWSTIPTARENESHPGYAVAGIDVNGLARYATGQVTQEERSSATHFHLGNGATQRSSLLHVVNHVEDSTDG